MSDLNISDRVFKVNDYLSLRLERNSTGIYVKDTLFSKCKYLLLNVPSYYIEDKEYDFSIDSASKHLGKALEMAQTPKELGLTPEEEFRGHCSNLQAWAESGYDPNLLHSNLSFPLLKKLTDAGDPLAKMVFKKEVGKKFSEGHSSVITYMIDEGYFDYLNIDEFEDLIDELDFNVISIKGLVDGIINYYKVQYGQKYISKLLEEFCLKLKRKRSFFYFPLLKKLAIEGTDSIKDLFIEEIGEKFLEGDESDTKFLIREGFVEYLDRDDIKEISKYYAYPELQFVLKGHMDRVNCIAFSPDGKYLISGGGPFDKTIKIWDAESGNIIKTLYGHFSDVSSLKFTLDQKYIISGSWDKTIRIWEFPLGNLVSTLKGHRSWVRSIGISNDNKFIASGSGDTRNEDYVIRIWDLSRKSLAKTLDQLYSEVNAVIFSRDGRYLISGEGENRRKDFTIKVWDLDTGKLKRWSENYSNGVISLDISPDGKYIVSGSIDNTIKIWDFSDGSLINTLESHDLHVLSVAFSSDGNYILSGSADGTVKLWDAKEGQLLHTLIGHSIGSFNQNCWINSVAISPSNNLLACGAMDNGIKMYRINIK